MTGRLRHNAWQEGFTMSDEVKEQFAGQGQVAWADELSTNDELAEAEQPEQVGEEEEAVGPVEVGEGAVQEAVVSAVGPAEPEMAFSWQASEFVHHHKSMGWYAALIGVVAVLVGGAVILHLWLYIAVFLMMGIAVVVYARKPPRTMMYELSSDGVHIDGKLFPFSEFRSFGVMPDEEWHSIDLEPAKRFYPRMVLLFDTEDFDSIVGHLELHLPRVDRNLDIIESVTRYLRF
jgi:hypothetical protein